MCLINSAALQETLERHALSERQASSCLLSFPHIPFHSAFFLSFICQKVLEFYIISDSKISLYDQIHK